MADASRLDSATVGAREGVVVLLDLDAENLSRAVVHPKRAKLDCDAKLQVTTDGPLQVAKDNPTGTYGDDGLPLVKPAA